MPFEIYGSQQHRRGKVRSIRLDVILGQNCVPNASLSFWGAQYSIFPIFFGLVPSDAQKKHLGLHYSACVPARSPKDEGGTIEVACVQNLVVIVQHDVTLNVIRNMNFFQSPLRFPSF